MFQSLKQERIDGEVLFCFHLLNNALQETTLHLKWWDKTRNSVNDPRNSYLHKNLCLIKALEVHSHLEPHEKVLRYNNMNPKVNSMTEALFSMP